MRQGAIWIPDWPTVAAERAGDAPPGAPIVIAGGGEVLSANAWARRAGICEGMKRRTAHHLCPDAVFLPPNPERDARYFEPVLHAIDYHIAQVTIREPGSAIFLARGPLRVVSSAEDLADALVGDIADIAETEANVGFADGTLATILAARENTIVPEGESAHYLAFRSTDTLLLGGATPGQRIRIMRCVELCSRLGIRTIGDVVALGLTALTTRFGETGALIWQLASGEDVRTAPRTPRARAVSNAHTFEPPIESIDRVTFAAKEAAHNLAEEMAALGSNGGTLHITAFMEDGQQFSRSWSIEGGNEKDIVDRTRWQLGAWIAASEERSGIVRLQLEIDDLIVLGERPVPLWGGKKANAEQASRSASCIQSLIGETEVRRICRRGGRIPHEWYTNYVWGESPSTKDATQLPWPGAIPPPGPALLHATPRPISLIGKCGHLLGVRGDGCLTCTHACMRVAPALMAPEQCATRSGEKVSASGTKVHDGVAGADSIITNFAGPWVVEEHWWDKPVRRAYLQVAFGNSAALVYCEHGQWFEEGQYV
ncbi:MAG: DNA polymerase Y family protein [Ancrocorticia sp.]|nr:DNA polymerase Y family protein [Ancrocorticia sp.]